MSGAPELPAPRLANAAPGAALPMAQRGCLGRVFALASVLLGSIYVVNPGFGIFELIPDNIPIFGNLDEAAATTMMVLGLQFLFGRGKSK